LISSLACLIQNLIIEKNHQSISFEYILTIFETYFNLIILNLSHLILHLIVWFKQNEKWNGVN